MLGLWLGLGLCLGLRIGLGLGLGLWLALGLGLGSVFTFKRPDCFCRRTKFNVTAQPHDPQLRLGKRFASPKKRWTGRAKRVQRREAARNLAFSEESPSSSGCTPAKDDETAVSANDDEAVVEEHPLLVAQVGEQLETEYQLH